MDTTDPKKQLSNLKVRQAINMAIDKANVVKLHNGRGGVADCILPPAMPGLRPERASRTPTTSRQPRS